MTLPVRHRDLTSERMQRWEPFRELEQLQEATSQLLENGCWGAGIPDARVWSPPVDIAETDHAWVVEAELPGVDRKDVSVELRDPELAITGEGKQREHKGLTVRVPKPDQARPRHIEVESAAR